MRIFFVIVLTVSALAYAQFESSYLGFGAFKGDGTRVISNAGTTNTYIDYDSKGIDIRFGSIEQFGNRVEASASIVNTQNRLGSESVMMGIGLDAVYVPYKSKDTFITPYISLGVGTHILLDNEYYTTSDDNDSFIDGISVNGALGFYMELDKGVELNLAYRAAVMLWDAATNEFDEHINISEGMTNIYIGLLFKQ